MEIIYKKENIFFNNDGSFNIPIDIMIDIFNYIPKNFIYVSNVCKFWNYFIWDHINDLDFFPYSDQNGKVRTIDSIKTYEEHKKIQMTKVNISCRHFYQSFSSSILKKLIIDITEILDLYMDLINLEFLEIRNNIKGVINAPKLKYLICPDAINFKTIPNLKTLKIGRFNDKVFTFIQQFPNLYKLDIALDFDVLRTLFLYVCKYTKIVELYMSYISYGNFESILDISSNNIEILQSPLIININNFPKLKKLICTSVNHLNYEYLFRENIHIKILKYHHEPIFINKIKCMFDNYDPKKIYHLLYMKVKCLFDLETFTEIMNYLEIYLEYCLVNNIKIKKPKDSYIFNFNFNLKKYPNFIILKYKRICLLYWKVILMNYQIHNKFYIEDFLKYDFLDLIDKECLLLEYSQMPEFIEKTILYDKNLIQKWISSFLNKSPKFIERIIELFKHKIHPTKLRSYFFETDFINITKSYKHKKIYDFYLDSK